MKLIASLIILLWSSAVSAQQLAFPTAEGFGRFATGGRGGIVCHVTSTAHTTAGGVIGSGPHHAGTFRYCVTLSATRTVVVDVAGTIDFGQTVLNISQPNLTIAAQTAPGDGIAIKAGKIVFRADQVVARYLRQRIGVISDQQAAYSFGGIVTDGLNGSGETAIIDHCSLAWSVDDTLGSFWSTNVTYQWCISAEGLRQTIINSQGGAELSRGKGIWIGGDNNRTSVLHTAFINQDDRIPNAYEATIQFVNNLVYNSAPSRANSENGSATYEFVKNYWLPGPSEPSTWLQTMYDTADGPNSLLYLEGNYDPILRPDNGFPEDSIVIEHGSFPTPMPLASSRPSVFPVPGSETTALQARTDILANAGATRPVRDAIDARLIQNVIDGTGSKNPNSPPSPGFITYSGTARDENYDTDADGIPNAWETQCSDSLGGLSGSDPNDGNDILSGVHANVNGYSKLEVYLNEVAGDYDSSLGAGDGLNTCGGLLTAGDTTGPTGVAITAPTESATVNGATVPFSATATDAESAITSVQFYVNDSLIGTDTTGPSPYSMAWDTTLAPDGNKTLHVIATSGGGPTQSADVHVEVDNEAAHTAIHVAAPPTIDGNLTEFSGANNVQISGTAEQVADFKFMWDDDNLYMGANIQDTQLVSASTTHDNSLVWSDSDAIEIVIDTDNDGIYDTTDYKFIVNVGEITWDASGPTFNTAAYEPTYSVQTTFVGDLNGGGVDTSWAIEIAIPWLQLNSITPAAAQVYGINVQIDDMDASRTVYRWNGGINNIADAMDVALGQETPPSDTEDPTVSITAPLDSAFVGGTYQIQANAQDNVGIDTVQFFEGANLLCTDSDGAPYLCNWNTTLETEGAYILTAEACDIVSNCTTSSPATSVTVDNTDPSTPQNLSLSTGYNNGEFSIFANWDDSTDANGSPTYAIERCQGVNCDTFAAVDTSLLSDFSDGFLAENTIFCYQVRAIDAAQNPSGYSDAECMRTLEVIGTFVADGAIDSLSGLTSLSFIGGGNIDSISGLSSLSLIDGGVIDSVSGLTSLGFITDGQIDAVSVD